MNRKIFCATLGCDKNLVDSEALLGRFRNRGAVPVDDPETADVWILNSCGFIEAARIDSEDTLRRFLAHKGHRTLVVCGCWSQEHGERIRREYPGVDLVAGVGQFDQVVAACLARAPAVTAPDFPLLVDDPMAVHYTGLLDRPLLTPPHVAFVKIAEGCNCACTFCRIPLIRGRQRSRSVAEIVAEVEGLVARGVGEIQIVSQNTSDFGRDTGEKLLELVTALDGVAGLRRQRLLYLYAGMVTVDDLRRLLDLPTVAPYLDLPVQHASKRMLRAMRRPGGEAGSLKFFRALREDRPDLVLRSTALLGFPGEEEEDVTELADFLAAVEFDHLGTYRYSPEKDTAAAALPDRVPDEVILDREARIMDLQSEISLGRQVRRLGRSWSAVVDRIVPADADEMPDLLGAVAGGTWLDAGERAALDGVLQGGGEVAVARSEHYGYDLDGVVVLPAADLRPGSWVEVDFLGASPYDSWARPVAAGRRKGGT